MTTQSKQDNKTARAQLRYIRIAPRKARKIVDMVRGLPTIEAEAQLLISPRRSSRHVLKLLRSAVANARNNYKMNESNLYINEIRVDEGPTHKRWEPRAQGRVNIIGKKTSHISIVLAEKQGLKPRFVIPREKKEDKKNKEEKAASTENKVNKEENRATDKEKDTKPESTKIKKIKEKPGFLDKVFRRKSI